MKYEQDELVADRFLLERELCRGAMGTVWLAQDTELGAPCAVKFLHSELFDQQNLRLRFEREAKALAAVRSPHVVELIDFGVWEGSPYLAMELLEGEDLATRLGRVGTLGADETMHVLAQVALALTKAHAKGVVHRDLKPENIFIAIEDDHEIVKLVDFGIARIDGAAKGERATTRGVMLGTPGYMSPEQALGSLEVDLRSDVWSFGVVAYECLVGKLPFQGDTVMETAMQILAGEMPVPSELADVPKSFDAWWFKSVARAPGDRFQSPKEQVEALALALRLPKASLVPTLKRSLRAPPMPAPIGPISLPPRSPKTSTNAGLARGEPHLGPTQTSWRGLGFAAASLALLGLVTFNVLGRRAFPSAPMPAPAAMVLVTTAAPPAAPEVAPTATAEAAGAGVAEPPAASSPSSKPVAAIQAKQPAHPRPLRIAPFVPLSMKTPPHRARGSSGVVTVHR